MDPLQITLIDDDASFCEMVKDHITKKFPNAQIAAHATGEAALDATLQKPDIIILDYSLDSVKAFAGEDYEVAVVPDAARAVLSRWDDRSAHYEVAVSPEP